jgi:hypothetical protein
LKLHAILVPVHIILLFFLHCRFLYRLLLKLRFR